MFERYGDCTKHCGTRNNCANKPGFLRHDVLLLDCRTLEQMFSTVAAENHSGIEGETRFKRCLSPINRKWSHGVPQLGHSGSFATLAAMRRASQVDIRKGLVASVAALLYASPRDLACSVNEFNCLCMNSV